MKIICAVFAVVVCIDASATKRSPPTTTIPAVITTSTSKGKCYRPGTALWKARDVDHNDTLFSLNVIPSARQTAFVRLREVTARFVLKGCRNDERDCEDISNPGFILDDINWKTSKLSLKSNTKKVIFRYERFDRNFGDVEVDSVGIGKTNKTSDNPCCLKSNDNC